MAVTLIPATSLPKSGSVTATATITSALASRGSHSSFCSSVPPLTSARVRISGLVISEPPMPRLARLSSSVAMTMARYSLSPPSEKPPYSAGTDSPKAPSSASPVMICSGTSPLVRWTCFGVGGDDVGREGAERVLDHVHVIVEVARTRRLGEGGEELRVAVRRQGWQQRLEDLPVGVPQLFPTDDPADEVVDDVSGEGARDRRLEVALGAIVEQDPSRRHGGGGVGDVVGEHLVDIGAASVTQGGDPAGDHSVGGGDQLRRGSKVRAGGHERRIYPRVTLG